MAPAGNAAALRAALAAGADAVYMGMARWSARAYAGNFDARALLEAIDLAHLHGARTYLTLNTLLKEEEIDEAVEALHEPYLAGLDAVLVADLGFAARVRRRYPDLALHASTQLNTHSSAQLAQLARLGFARAVLARELSLDEIRALDPHGLELEVFVHGALCYGYSGLCLFSSMVGGRSGNRGRCAQACRMQYRLSVSASDAGRPRGTTEGSASRGAAVRGRLLSTADLAAIGLLPQLVAAGVRAFKIEGRMKDASYVATAVAVYREALDTALAAPEAYSVRPEWLERLEQSFSRGFTTGHLDGCHTSVRSGGRGGHRGVLVGRVERVQRDEGLVTVKLSRALHAGDVVYLCTSRGQSDPARLEDAAAERVTLRTTAAVSPKDRLFRLAAAAVDGPARDAIAGRAVARPLALAARLSGREGQPARLEMRLLPSGRPAATVVSSRALEPARAAVLDPERVRAAVCALGGTPYALDDLELDMPDGLFLPVAELRDLRRRAVAAIDEERLSGYRRAEPASAESSGTARESVQSADLGQASARPARIGDVCARSGSAARSARAAPGGETRGETAASAPRVVLRVSPSAAVVLPPGDAALCLTPTVDDDPVWLAGLLPRLSVDGTPVRCRPPALLFDTDMAWWQTVAELPWDAVYARHVAHLDVAAPVIVEYPLLGLTVGTVQALWGDEAPTAEPSCADMPRLHGVVASPELALEEIGALAASLNALVRPAVLEIVVFGRQELLLSRDRLGEAEGLVSDPAAGGCSQLQLEDAKGFCFPTEVDARGTSIANARVTNLTRHLNALRGVGVKTFVVDERSMDAQERTAFQVGGLEALAAFAARDRFTTGHLFRGVL